MITDEESREAFEIRFPMLHPESETIRNGLWIAWQDCLAWAEQRIREDERDRLARLADERTDGWCSLAADEIRAGKLRG
jgi:hypothetical protein